MAHPWLPRLPETLLALFGVLVVSWLGLQELSLLLVVPLSVAVLAGIHLFKPSRRPTQIGLGVAYVVGGLVAGFLLLGFMIPGGTPDEYEAYARVATPLLGLYAAAVVALVVKLN
ncbi:hypothetical protein JCM17823_24010 [Halorubrum gandharaense]